MFNTKSSLFTSSTGDTINETGLRGRPLHAEVDNILDRFQVILEDMNLTNIRPTLRTYLTDDMTSYAFNQVSKFHNTHGTNITYNKLSLYLYCLSCVLLAEVLPTYKAENELAGIKRSMHYVGEKLVSFPEPVEEFFHFEDNYKLLFVIKNYDKYKHLKY